MLLCFFNRQISTPTTCSSARKRGNYGCLVLSYLETFGFRKVQVICISPPIHPCFLFCNLVLAHVFCLLSPRYRRYSAQPPFSSPPACFWIRELHLCPPTGLQICLDLTTLFELTILICCDTNSDFFIRQLS